MIALAGAFVAGMVITDGLNGWWVARLLRRSDRLAARASRIMVLSVACVSLGTALIGVATRLSPAFAAWAGAHESRFGLLVVGVVFIGFLAGRWMVTPAGAGDGAEDARGEGLALADRGRPAGALAASGGLCADQRTSR